MKIKTSIWRESAEDISINGYKLFTDICPHASYCDYILLLIYGEQPRASQTRLLQRLAILLANRGPLQAFMHAAMSAGATGSSPASILYAASAVNAGWLNGSVAVKENMLILQQLRDMPSDSIKQHLESYLGRAATRMYYADGMPEQCPLFDGDSHHIEYYLAALCDVSEDSNSTCHWLRQHLQIIQGTHDRQTLSIAAVAAAAFIDLGLDGDQASTLYLWLCLPGAIAHAQEQAKLGWQHFPFQEFDLEFHMESDDTIPLKEQQHA